jgi:phage baseplate assembly protein W
MARPVRIDVPFRVDVRGRTAQTTVEDHVRDLVGQVLLTSQGERVMRPTFGTNLAQLLFDGNGPHLATATQALVQGALQQWLGDVIAVEDVEVSAEESVLRVAVRYRLPGGPSRTTTFERAAP